MKNEEVITNLKLPMAIIKCAGEWTVEEANEAFCKLTECKREELVQADNWERIIYERDRAVFEAAVEQAIRHKEKPGYELRICLQGRKPHWVQMKCALYEQKNAVPYVGMVFWDIHKQKTTEMELKLLNEQYQLLDEVTREIPFDMDVEHERVLCPARLFELRGEQGKQDEYIAVSEAVKQIHPLDQDGMVKAIRGAMAEVSSGKVDYRMNVGMKHSRQNYVWFRTFYRSIADEDDRVIRIIGRTYNIDKDKILQDEVRKDPLTKLLNKAETQKEVQRIIDEYPNMTHVMFIIDVDNFKGINDTFGHTYGDTVILDIAAIIREHFRPDDVVARVGGDEFLVFMKNSTQERAVKRAQSLCAALEKEYTGQEVKRRISVSVGLAVYGKDGDSYETLFEKADHAMYRAKNDGKAGVRLAESDDVGPIRVKDRRVEKRMDLSQSDREFLTYAFGLMTHARNIDGSLNMLLKRIAIRFDLELVALVENESEQMDVLTNYYSDRYTFYDKMPLPKMNLKLKTKESGDIAILNKVPVFDLDMLKRGAEKPEISKELPCTVVVGTYEYIGGRTGAVYYFSLDRKRMWEKSELDLLRELTRVISIFVTLRCRVDESRAEILHMQRRDQLTGLFNYEGFKEQGRKLLQSREADKVYALEYLDVNNFGYVNDNYGYQVGDKALKMFAADASNQPYFRLGCRLYSDFFALLVADESVELLEKHLTAQHQRFANMQNHRYSNSGMGVSAGVVVIDPDGGDIETALENAMLAWKVAKTDRKRELVFFTPDLRKKRMDEQQIIGEFHEALYRDDFRMYLQPKFILGERRIYGAEALARWQKPDGKVLAPGAFLEPLESIGYVTELDFYIFEELLKTMSRWSKQNKPELVVSTNFSGRHFDGDGKEFLTRLFNIYSKYDVPARNIEIEITEGVLVKNASVLKDCLNQLREKGFRVAIDDFGTGYSSLAVLTDIPSDVVKMDRSFISKGITGQRKDLIAEVGKLVRIAKKDIIFEGIENEEQEQFLMNCGFSHGQGYLCNRPIRIAEFENLYLNADCS